MPSADELSALLEAAIDGPHYAPLVLILATGIRRGELLALKWHNIDLDGAFLQIVEAIGETRTAIRLKESKTQAGQRRVDRPPFAVETLREHRLRQKEDHLAMGLGWTIDTLVFPTIDGELQRLRNFTKAVTRLAATVGVKFSPHLGRHDHFTRLLAAGIHPKVAQIRAGHGSVAVTMDIYSHAMDALQQPAVEQTQDIFGEICMPVGGKWVAKPIFSEKSRC